MSHPRSLPLVVTLLALAAAACSSGCSHIGQPRVIYIARHGQTEWNRKARMQGDPDLDQVGYINRLSLWKLLRKAPLGAIYTSERQRTRKTAELLARQHGLPIQIRPALNEIDPGVFEGICFSQLEPASAHAHDNECVVRARGSRPEATLRYARAAFRTGWGDRVDGKPPLGQSFRELAAQVKVFVDELERGFNDREVLVVGHGVINRALLHHLFGWPLEVVARLRQENDQVYKVTFEPTPRLQLYTPGVGWRRCMRPPSPGDRGLDCSPGERTAPPPAPSPAPEAPGSAPAGQPGPDARPDPDARSAPDAPGSPAAKEPSATEQD